MEMIVWRLTPVLGGEVLLAQTRRHAQILDPIDHHRLLCLAV